VVELIISFKDSVLIVSLVFVVIIIIYLI
jgi:hypothetical protein